MIDFAKLKAPFAPERVSWRVGSTTADKKKGMALAYIDARDVMERLDEICGPAGWQRAYPHANGKTVCAIGIKIDSEWIWKADGAGDSDIEAEKGALSDAFKRAAVSWGIGRYLYDIDSPWVEIEPFGRSFKIKESAKPALLKVLGGQKAPPPEKQEEAPKPFELVTWEGEILRYARGGEYLAGIELAFTNAVDKGAWWNDNQQQFAKWQTHFQGRPVGNEFNRVGKMISDTLNERSAA